jgi:RNA polymerase sigma-70 factor (ECF subfamily)
MKSPGRRSAGVTRTLAMPLSIRDQTSERLDVEALYRTSRDDVFAYAMTLLRDRSAAEDVTALAFERAFRRRRSYRPGRGSPRAWLFGIARNAALDELRRRGRTAALHAEPADEAPGPEDAADQGLRRAVVRQALAGLVPRDRELVGLKFHAGLSNAEIARVLGVSESNAGTQLHRAMRRLREACDATP